MNTTHDNDNTLDQPEVEVMPGVYMTDFRNGKNHSNKQKAPQLSLQEQYEEKQAEEEKLIELAAQSLEQEVGELAQQYEHLNAQMEQLKNIQKYKTIYELTGFTGAHLLEQIQLKIEELSKLHNHLIDSQVQLKELLSLDDPVITEAYEENKYILEDQKYRLEKLYEEEEGVLKQLGPHYASSREKAAGVVKPEPVVDAPKGEGLWL